MRKEGRAVVLGSVIMVVFSRMGIFLFVKAVFMVMVVCCAVVDRCVICFCCYLGGYIACVNWSLLYCGDVSWKSCFIHGIYSHSVEPRSSPFVSE